MQDSLSAILKQEPFLWNIPVTETVAWRTTLELVRNALLSELLKELSEEQALQHPVIVAADEMLK